MKVGEEKLTLSQRISQPFITGLIGFLPLALTLAILAWVVVFLHDLVGPKSEFGKILSKAGLNLVVCESIAYLVGLVGTLVVVYVFGLLVESGRAGRYHFVVEGALHRVPLVGTIYDASKQLTSVFDRKNEDVKAMSPVLCTFGGQGGAAMLALLPSPKVVHIDGYDYHVVIVPTAPVPFGGALVLVPVDSVKPAGCSVDGLVSVFMSMGASAPQVLGTAKDDKLEICENDQAPE
ncbi:hypothetical protein Pla144_05090 [Bythopirellula polymerisocia]|uniref:DUF502 domain-containing protein n=2 Tax=Bythopirellula polymerisocia TaxID=2528003 RepID=A0A5C6CYS8_9BACT|nr:hypothetical protein Pla144_05090 [Bythopirellula polymerisocia]